DAGRGHLEEAAARIERALELVDGMLRLAQAGRRAVGPPVAVGPLLHRVVGSLDVPAGFRIEWPDPGPTVLGDADALGQVFRNLLDNAIKHHDRSDGTVRITARERGAQHEFCVTDDGPGIPLPMHATLFQPFQPGARGTGLGLALVRQAVEAQGGTICAEPAPPRGLTLRFTWPREAA
ncbi:MAG TPA: HAMP domain-containing sensor histidine kinase, partial [Candidatus Thermoplasmatota archaeon]|nr:HAMP domain-containing sensor histidine kinase [Candidatus Thermoplasmatota archaeon]